MKKSPRRYLDRWVDRLQKESGRKYNLCSCKNCKTFVVLVWHDPAAAPPGESGEVWSPTLSSYDVRLTGRISRSVGGLHIREICSSSILYICGRQSYIPIILWARKSASTGTSFFLYTLYPPLINTSYEIWKCNLLRISTGAAVIVHLWNVLVSVWYESRSVDTYEEVERNAKKNEYSYISARRSMTCSCRNRRRHLLMTIIMMTIHDCDSYDN